MLNTPESVMSPPALTLKLPVSVVADKAIAALSNCRVRLRKPVGKVGVDALALVLRNARSLTLPLLVMTKEEAKLFA